MCMFFESNSIITFFQESGGVQLKREAFFKASPDRRQTLQLLCHSALLRFLCTSMYTATRKNACSANLKLSQRSKASDFVYSLGLVNTH